MVFMRRFAPVFAAALFLLLAQADRKSYAQVNHHNSSWYRKKTTSQNKLRGYYGLPYRDREAIRRQENLSIRGNKMLEMQYKKY